jgi:RNA polymerase sigma factor (TIGR02999 family)
MPSTEPSSGGDPNTPQPLATPQDATVLMAAAANGDKAAADRLLPLVYAQLRSAAQLCLAGERLGHTLSATAIVHEAYIKLSGPRQVPWEGRGHFYAAAAEAMRQVLLDHAKGRLRLKRGGGGGGGEAVGRQCANDFEDVAALSQQEPEQIVKFDDLVRRLEAESPDGAAVVRLRFFAGLSVEQTAQVLGLSISTVDRRWAFARAWLFQRLQERA